MVLTVESCEYHKVSSGQFLELMLMGSWAVRAERGFLPLPLVGMLPKSKSMHNCCVIWGKLGPWAVILQLCVSLLLLTNISACCSSLCCMRAPSGPALKAAHL